MLKTEPMTKSAVETLPAGIWKIGTVAILGSFLSQLDATVVNVSLPTLAVELHSTLSTIQWVTGGYMLMPFGSVFTVNNLGIAPFHIFDMFYDYGAGVLFDYATGQIKIDSTSNPLSTGSGTWLARSATRSAESAALMMLGTHGSMKSAVMGGRSTSCTRTSSQGIIPG